MHTITSTAAAGLRRHTVNPFYAVRLTRRLAANDRPFSVLDGIPFRMELTQALGNAVVPQIPELVGRAILRHKQLRHLAT